MFSKIELPVFFVVCNPVVTRMQSLTTEDIFYLIKFRLHFYVCMFYITQDSDALRANAAMKLWIRKMREIS